MGHRREQSAHAQTRRVTKLQYYVRMYVIHAECMYMYMYVQCVRHKKETMHEDTMYNSSCCNSSPIRNILVQVHYLRNEMWFI